MSPNGFARRRVATTLQFRARVTPFRPFGAVHRCNLVLQPSKGVEGVARTHDQIFVSVQQEGDGSIRQGVKHRRMPQDITRCGIIARSNFSPDPKDAYEWVVLRLHSIVGPRMVNAFPRLQIAVSSHRQLLLCRVVIQVLPEPSLDLYHAHALAFAIVGDLIAVDLAQAEISRFWMGEVEPTHARSGPHRK
jgi:hypothetical protein